MATVLTQEEIKDLCGAINLAEKGYLCADGIAQLLNNCFIEGNAAFCLDDDGGLYTFNVPKQIEYKDCPPAVLKRLIKGLSNE